ncbi:HlyD family efflux transporter periplasmic adaptor subunit [Alloprevotella tannerae]|uniref:HlyD family secretion protein n=1 Tax=Alloprevotella tannerae TaxID=76122 RepID=UPI0028E54A07|nr:HlyD family efflux transporter periplasmic adaptor subunit [Alloprevotella tannerae]
MKKTVIAIAAFTLLVSACDNKEKEFDATGIFEATEVTVSAEATGLLMTFDISEGKLIEAHQQVGLIDTVQLQLKAQQIGATRESFAEQRPDISAQIAATRQQLSKAELEQKRTAALFADGAATRKQTDDASNAVRVLQGQLKAQISALSNSTRSLNSQVSGAEIQRLQVLDQLKKCHITSPIAGTVLEKYAEQGEFATIGKPLFKVADTRNMFIRAYITSRQLAQVKLGQRVKVFSNYGSDTRRSYSGTVTWISPNAEFTPKSILTDDERADIVYAVKIAVINDGYLKMGMYGEVKL